MKIVETLTPTNADKTFLGDKNIKLTLDTETDRLTIVTPAMFTNPVVQLSELRAVLDKLSEHTNR